MCNTSLLTAQPPHENCKSTNVSSKSKRASKRKALGRTLSRRSKLQQIRRFQSAWEEIECKKIIKALASTSPRNTKERCKSPLQRLGSFEISSSNQLAIASRVSTRKLKPSNTQDKKSKRKQTVTGSQDKDPASKRQRPEPKTAAAPDVEAIISRILAAESPESVLGIDNATDEVEVLRAWKALVLHLHPDKVASLSEWVRTEAANALQMVHEAKEEIKRKQQETTAEVPDMPQPETTGGRFRLNCAKVGERKFELRWKPHTNTDPLKPVERYEIWGPRIFSEAGEPFEWILLATCPPLQNSFVFVEEAPTQQDVMWAADKVRVPYLPINVYSCNGKGSSEPCTYELPWGEKFAWLKGVQSLLCSSCNTVNVAWDDCVQCTNCGGSASIPIILRCPECHGEALWDDNGTTLSFRCCGKVAAQAQHKWGATKKQHWQGKPGRHGAPRMRGRS